MATFKVTRWLRFKLWLIRPFRKRVPGCADTVCRPDMPHRPCADCGQLTDSSTIRVEPGTLRRRKVFVCDSHRVRSNSRDEQLRKERAYKDWREITDPLVDDALRIGQMPEQIPGPTRAALRAFRESGDTRAVVDGINASTLNQSLRALGLDDEMYAETRGNETVLRRVEVNGNGRRGRR